MEKKMSFLLIAGLMLSVSCKKEIEPGMRLSIYEYASVDADGGTWKPILLSAPDQIAVPPPADPASADFQAELAAVKAASANVTAEQKKIINYWGNNGVLRWNEIAQLLVAKYFLLPAPLAQPIQTKYTHHYTWPDPNNPAAYPQFPFSSPPYASRAYAYLSAGTYDALIACWHYKYLYNRQAPSHYDASIPVLLPLADLPAYPSEDAVIAGYSRTVLTWLFPLEADFLAQKAQEHINSRLWAGTNAPSDLAAGDSLGTAIAKIFISRGKGDGMKNTLGTFEQYDSIYDAWAGKSHIWKSLEIPPRQPLAINFGHVLPWTITKEEVTTVFRLPPPPEPGTPEFQEAWDELRDLTKNATKEQKQIALKWDDGPSTYGPPGHWNAIACKHIHDAAMNPLRAARVLAYMNMAIQDAGICVWDNKYFYYYPRPCNVDPNIKTLLGVPNFPAYPSGHSGFSGAAYAVLAYFFPEHAASFHDMAKEASNSRIYGCIHWRFDCTTGLTLGEQVAQRAIDMAKADGADH
ncbi:MAG: phosphatase PAP2 family protein [Chitinophagales bacterium]|nr:phosphatase PAP2 family protein [Chitinophagales bacterium]MDW8427320.1 phosphatase PAP2 family protein [Chitinophagales bacterium]